ncbi:hypothetical protein [Lacticaseibacillus daqingensis]|uniref:hypothetical protein n=1 Tax=Lacticaseibacillus daqingensis TaxID=2486014 RepID=UPI000F784CB9|nr:hypothetical protein [Lacticaseibacillus daqingensis]
MINENAVADYITGLAILTHSLPADLRDANGDNLPDCLTQSLRDLAAELGVSAEVRWDTPGAPANVAVVDSLSLARLIQGTRLIQEGYAGLGDPEAFTQVMRGDTNA